MKNLLLTTCLLLVAMGSVLAQLPVLEQYIRQGLQSNLSLQRQQQSLEKAQLALQEAKGLFYPSLSFLSDYNYANGGRKIDLPLGDLFNPIYQSLNQLQQGQKFSNIPNQQVLFLPNNFQDTRLQASMALINTEIWYNYKIHREMITQQQAMVNVYKRNLVKDLKAAYYNYLNSLRQQDIYNNAATLLKEQYRSTSSLVNNGKALRGNLLKVDADIHQNDALLTAATNDVQVAKAYFNFLLNQPLETPIPADTSVYAAALPDTVPALSAAAVTGRDELKVLQSGLTQTNLQVKMKQAAYVPELSTFINGGYQGTGYTFSSDQRYLFGGVSLKWTLFNGNQRRAQLKQAEVDRSSLQNQLAETQQQLALELTTAQTNLHNAQARLGSALASQSATREYYRETKVRYAEGLVLLLEVSDAFTQFVNSQLAYQLALTEVLTREAELEQVTAAYPL
ncbi:Outer membrane protein TolC [Chitinophaga costaii]|uniref:Outer membrane protein TolC n=1 Tax=Chitinophaga costaii TaxID=1335309 RepID=A0A1C4CBA1_9BACT|nr:TolC family protein [Chitinophaga costaii]PUZ27162.1 TolC family protein [Chitinophaga costaii]SCC16264.1 Outer membrane protein TolC [Chitinophaga costaii]